MIDYKKRKIRAHRIKRALTKNQTLSEIKFKEILNEIGINYKFQKKIFTEKNFYIADFYLPKHKVIFEIDGGYHNDNFEYDNHREINIFKTGKIKLIARFPNEFIKNNKENIKKEVIDIINKKGKFYQGLINRKLKILNEIGAEKQKKRKRKKFLKKQLKQRPHIKSRLTTQEYEVISMLLGLKDNKPYSEEEVGKEVGISKNRIIKIIGKLYWLIKTD